jgi:hypothetical protein
VTTRRSWSLATPAWWITLSTSGNLSMRKILKLARKLPLKKGAKYLAGILHDDDCPALSGGFCRCNPEITLYVVERKKRGCKK